MEAKNKLIILILAVIFSVTGCTKEDLSPVTEGYVVGSFRGGLLDRHGNTTGKLTKRAFCIYVERLEHPDSLWPLDFYTFDLPKHLFDFPEEIIGDMNSDCGPVFFPDSLKTRYKIRFRYRYVSERKKIKFGVICFDLTFPWKMYREVTLKDVVRIEK